MPGRQSQTTGLWNTAMARRKSAGRTDLIPLPAKELTGLRADVRELIVQAREGAARAVDAGLTTLYWHVGQRIRQDILKEKRAEYGEQIVSALSAQLEQEFGRGFGRRNLFRMVRFAEVFPDSKIVSAMRTQLGWTHSAKGCGWRGRGWASKGLRRYPGLPSLACGRDFRPDWPRHRAIAPWGKEIHRVSRHGARTLACPPTISAQIAPRVRP